MEQSISRCGTRDNILNATLEIIGEEGFQKVTIRKIAALAGVNVAAVNYHFGSKEVVINEALRYMTGKLRDSFSYLCDPLTPPDERVKNFIRSYADAALQYPDVFRNFVNHSMCNQELSTDYAEFLKREGIEELKNTIREIRNGDDEIQLFMKSFQIISGIAFPVLLGSQMEKLSGINYEDINVRYEYLDVLMKTVLENV